jgi:adenylosuccinate synthase
VHASSSGGSPPGGRPPMKKNVAVVGLQWGDEGKGKIVDILADGFDCVARYQGGHNAGHTVTVGDRRHVLHVVPSGIFHKNVICVIGSGVVLDPQAFIEEVDALKAIGTDINGRLLVSNRCHVILPYHRVLESAFEKQLGEKKIGTTLRGIGPAYEDKAARRGLRVCDLLDSSTLLTKLKAQVELKNQALAALQYPETVDAEGIYAAYESYGRKIRPFVIDSAAFLNKLLAEGKSILFEGAQATLLDIDHGTFPFVTSSSASAGGVASGLGVSPKYVNAVVGIMKAYTTRVGTGPFPTEANDACGETIRKRGSEFGATTGRPRRCGWFDGPAGRYSVMINAPDLNVVTKVDVLDTFSDIPVCTEYRYKGSTLKEFPAEIEVLAKVEPVYRTLPGWQTSTAGIREWKDLPEKAKDYLSFLSDYLNVPIGMVSTGPKRDETIHVKDLGI